MPSFAQTLMQLPTRSKIVLGARRPRPSSSSSSSCSGSRRRRRTRRSSRRSTRPTPARSPPRSTSRARLRAARNGTTVAVEKASVSQARIALASAGVVGLERPQQGFELFDEQKLGASDFQQKVTYQRALEGEIARTVEQVDGVSGAQVQLVLPEDSLFAEEASPSTAAVLLTGPSDALEPGAVRGIAQLTASSVKGLKTENVTITDGAGQLLWPQGDGAGAAGGALGSSKQAAERRYERQLQASLDALLTQTLGPGKARVQVKADLNVDQHQARAAARSTGKAIPSEVDDRDREAPGRRRGAPAAPRAPAATSRPTRSRRRRRRGQLELRPQEQDGREHRRQDGHDDRGRARRGQRARRSRSSSTRPSRRPTSPRSRTRSRAPPASTPSAATSSRPRRSRSPSRPPSRRPARCRSACSGR